MYLSLFCLCVTSAASSTTSLWGKKALFNFRPCVWQLQPGAVVPALEELTVCIQLRYTLATQWTGFAYKAPGVIATELGLGGTRTQLTVWMFGGEWHFNRELRENEWHSFCLTWSSQAPKVNVYINGTFQHGFQMNRSLPERLAPNGTLTLGVSHYVDVNGEVHLETGSNLVGEIGLFRMWAREWRAEELREQSCADGDVVSWDLQQWKYGCSPVSDSSLQCGKCNITFLSSSLTCLALTLTNSHTGTIVVS
uniref:Pentraxin (PTX) domain-containing protein n=1 Tax=Anabas testudineus TaxID=64144 RepID=A0A3Q1ITG5_ANATE